MRPAQRIGSVVGYAADVWWRVAPELHRLGLLTVVDVAPLAAYCVSYAHWRLAEETLGKMAERDPINSALLVKSGDGNLRRNPMVKIANDAARDMLTFASEFGLTPVARSRLAAGVGGQPGPSKFDGLIGPR
jgi:P27 family predicted phage terminase small subunit